MRTLILGVLLGSLTTASIGIAGNFYNSKEEPTAPRGSTQQFDYFRQRQQYLDIEAIRRNQDEQTLRDQRNPCGR